MRPLAWRACLFVLPCVALAACGGEKGPPVRRGPPTEFGKVINPDPDASPYVRATEVTYACGWGASGRISGRTVEPDGTVREWEWAPGEADVVELKRWRAQPALAAAVFQAMQQISFLDLAFHEHDDLGCKLTLTWPGGEHVVTWKARGMPQHVLPVLQAISKLRR